MGQGTAPRRPTGAVRRSYHKYRFALFGLRFCFSAWGGLGALLGLKERKIFAVTFFLQFFHRNEAQRGRVYAESLTGRGGTVVEKMTEMRIARFPANLSALHPEGSIALFRYVPLLDRFGEAGPTSAAVEFVDRTKERFAGDEVDVDSRLVIVPVGVVKRGFRAALTSHLVLVFG